MAESRDGAGRDPLRLALVACALVAAVTAGTVVASLGSGGLAGSPLDSVFPDQEPNESTDNGSATLDDPGTPGGSGGFGALSPGRQTGVGEDLGLDPETFAANDTSVHFTVESSRPTYWRTGAYDTYTGSGWERTVETDSYDGDIDHEGVPDERIDYAVTLEKQATALPTAWRPAQVSAPGDVRVTDSGSVQTAEPVSAETTYDGVSYAPERNPDLLRSVGRDTGAVDDRYTALPESVPSRLGERAAAVTADAETTYGTAVAVQNWLRQNKTYSLGASAEGENVADEFVFEMDRGYCEFFATAMTVMLRTQDVPARYVVGYTSGESVGDDTYEVRGMNAHAWVEVYFAEYGWVRFDPTPGDSRLDAQASLLDGAYDVEEPGSPGETFRTDDDTDTDENDTDDGTDNDTDPDDPEGPRLSVNGTPVAGGTAEVTVRHNGTPVEGAAVWFNGKRVGETDGDGTVTGPVPYREQLAVEAEHPVFERDTDAETTVAETYRVETDATVELTGETLPGRDVTVTALLDGRPVERAVVLLDGERVGTTDGDGQATVSLPTEAGTATIAVERGAVTGTRTVELPALNVTVESDLPVALPLGPATVTATYENVSAAGAPVEIGGERVGEIGPDGTASVRLPLSPSAVVTVAEHGASDTASVDGLVANLLLFVLLPVALVAGTAVALVYYGRRLGSAAGSAAGRLARSGTRLLVAGAGRIDRALGRVVTRAGDGSPLAAVGGRLRGLFERERDEASESRDIDGARGMVRDAWGRFLDNVSVDRAATQTPDELAVHAVERDGLPAEAVATLRDAFREVEYGSRPASERLDRVETAIERIERAAEESETARTEGAD